MQQPLFINLRQMIFMLLEGMNKDLKFPTVKIDLPESPFILIPDENLTRPYYLDVAFYLGLT